MLTALTHLILRRTVKKWFATDTDVRDTRRKLAGFIGRTDRLRRGWTIAPVAGSDTLHKIAPTRPLPDGAPLVLYLHGGGYIVGGLASHAAFCARLGGALGAAVLFADYRLAPEHRFPAAFEDGVEAWRRATLLATGPLFLAGDSAGGGLALAVAQAAIAQGLRAPDKIILLSPWTDLTLSGQSLSDNAETDSMLSLGILTRMRNHYVGARNKAMPAHPRCSIRMANYRPSCWSIANPRFCAMIPPASPKNCAPAARRSPRSRSTACRMSSLS